MVISFLHCTEPVMHKPKRSWALSLFWCIGLLVGLQISYLLRRFPIIAGNTLPDWFFFFKSLSVALPFLLSAWAMYRSCYRIFPLISCLKAIIFMIPCGIFSNILGPGRWLVVPMLMFSDVFSLPVLYLFWMRHMSEGVRFCWAECFWIVCFLVLLIGIDYIVVSPYILRLISF